MHQEQNKHPPFACSHLKELKTKKFQLIKSAICSTHYLRSSL